MPAAKNVVAAAEAVEKAPAPAATAPTTPATVTTFWKVMNPFEKILFKDGTDLIFGSQSFSTADESLVKKIKEVAARYGILTQKGE